MSITYLAKTDTRNKSQKFGIKQTDRRLHMHILGKTGLGKTTFSKNIIVQDIQAGRGVCLIDPHGDNADDVLNYVPSHRIDDVIYFNPADQNFPVGFNILENVTPTMRPLIASHILSIIKNVNKESSWGNRMEQILTNSILALLEYGGSTLLSVQRLLSDENFRKEVVAKIQDPVVKNYWHTEFDVYNSNFRTEAISPVQNKISPFITSTPIRNIVSQTKGKFDMRSIMDNKKILICNLSKGEIGESGTRLLGSLIVSKIFLSALQRADQPEHLRKDFHLFVDECQNLATPVLSSILSESRKFSLNLTLINQYLFQLPKEIKEAILGNVGTLVSFRLGASDAVELEQEYAPINATDLENLGKYQIYLKLAIDNKTSRPFSATTLPPTEMQTRNNREKIIKTSREKYGIRREVIEDKIKRWYSK